MSLVYFINPDRNFSQDVSYNVEDIFEDDERKFDVVLSVLLPVICSLGIIGNIISYLVMVKMNVKCSSYTYFTFRTAFDLGTCVLLLISVTISGANVRIDSDDFDILVTLPIAAIFSGVSVCATVFVTLDRLRILWDPQKQKKKYFCTPHFARRVMSGAIFITILFSLPYFFMFVSKDDGMLHATPFFKSSYYIYFNWVRLILYGILPSAILTIATGLLIFSIFRLSNKLKHLTVKRRIDIVDPYRLTLPMIAIVIFFLFGEVPGHILSKKAAFVFLYAGDISTVTTDEDLSVFRQVSLILGAVNASINFFVYYMLHPPFGRGLKLLCTRNKTKKRASSVQVNVFVINNKDGYNVKYLKTQLPKVDVFTTWVSR